MNLKTKSVVLFSFIFVSSVSFAQYKYDIGLKASTYDLERFQLEQRYHFDSPWSLVLAVTSGSRWTSTYTEMPIYNDSLFDIAEGCNYLGYHGLKIGVQRKLDLFATKVFYTGASLGVGLRKQREDHRLTTYSHNGIDENNPAWNPEMVIVSSRQYVYEYSEINAQLALSFGMDVPISKRFIINAELGMAAIYAWSTINLQGSVSGGLRYQFGVR